VQDGANPATGRYVLVYDPLRIPGAVNTIEPWRGYWVFAREECELLLTPSDGIIPNSTRAASDNTGAWAVRLQVQTSSGSAEAILGAKTRQWLLPHRDWCCCATANRWRWTCGQIAARTHHGR